MIKKVQILALIGLNFLFCNSAIADDGTGFALRVEPGFTYYENHIRIPGSRFSTGSNSLNYFDLTIGGTLFFSNGITIDAYYRAPISKPANHLKLAGVVSQVKVSRNEYNFSLSYALGSGFNIFTGWRSFSVKTSNTADPRFIIGLSPNIKFVSNGPTFGLSYGTRSNGSNFTHNIVLGGSYQQGKFTSSFATLNAKKSGLAFAAKYKLGYIVDDNWDVDLSVDSYYLRLNNLQSGTYNYSYIDATISGRVGVRYAF